MKTVVNIENNANLSEKGYPLFLGDDLGFADTINVTYPELAKLYEEQRSQFWIETEHSLAQDKIDFQENPEAGEVMVRNLMSQWLMDSIAARSIMTILEPFATNNELVEVLTAWTFFEGIHARTYSYIMRECFVNANDILERAKADVNVAYRSRIIGKIFNETAKMAAEWSAGTLIDKKVVKLQLLKTLMAIYSLEAISFMASFACTFAVTETGKFQGIGNDLTAICKDEMTHCKFGRTCLDIMLNKEEDYREIFEENREELQEILIECIRQEFSFSEYIFSDGRSTLGLTTSLLKEHVLSIASPVFDKFGFKIPDEFGVIPSRSPLRYMDKYLNSDLIQSAAQEITLVNYRVGQTVNDIESVEFDF